MIINETVFKIYTRFFAVIFLWNAGTLEKPFWNLNQHKKFHFDMESQNKFAE